MNKKIKCSCTKCSCKNEFEIIEKEMLLNALNHGWIKNQKQIEYLKNQNSKKICEKCFFEEH